MPWTLIYEPYLVGNQPALTLKKGKYTHQLNPSEPRILDPGRYELYDGDSVVFFRIARTGQLIVFLNHSQVSDDVYLATVVIGGIHLPLDLLPRYGVPELYLDPDLPHAPWHLEFNIDRLDEDDIDITNRHFIYFEHLTPDQVRLRSLHS